MDVAMLGKGDMDIPFAQQRIFVTFRNTSLIPQKWGIAYTN